MKIGGRNHHVAVVTEDSPHWQSIRKDRRTDAHLLCAIVLDEGVKWYHTVNLQKHWCGAQLLFAWPAAKVTGRRTSALLLTSNLHT